MVYNYTIPRGPIAAMYSSPGPKYNLPGLTGHIKEPHDPRSVHNKKPAYTFGLKPPLLDKTNSPGPGKYKPDSKLTRDGWDGTPHYTMRRKFPPIEGFSSPGPAAYNNEKGFPLSTQPTAPVYSLRDRTRLRALDKTPAPNSYTLPPTFCRTLESTKKQAPIYSMRQKSDYGSFCRDYAKAPGPGTYDATEPGIYKNKPPHYTMAPRVFMPSDNTIKPGPGAHRPEDCTYKVKKDTPKFTFGLKHSQYEAPVILEPTEPKIVDRIQCP